MLNITKPTNVGNSIEVIFPLLLLSNDNGANDNLKENFFFITELERNTLEHFNEILQFDTWKFSPQYIVEQISFFSTMVETYIKTTHNIPKATKFNLHIVFNAADKDIFYWRLKTILDHVGIPNIKTYLSFNDIPKPKPLVII